MNTSHLSEQEQIRREKLGDLLGMGIDPFPAAMFPVNNNAVSIKENYTDQKKEEYSDVCVAGRIMSVRDMGKANFAVIQDSTGRIQLYIRRDDICPGEDKTLYDIVWKKCMDIGDIIGIKGYVFTTKTGETSIHVKELTVLAKSLKPLPIVKEAEGQTYDAVTDPEFKYRQRYADLIINPEVKEVFTKRTKLINAIREFLNERGALEVDTPVLQSIPGGAAARPFETHHNALDMPMFMRIANELYLKRLIVGGFEWVYEFSRNFRNEGMDRTHNPEFTVLEFYVAYKDYLWMMEITEQLLEKVAVAVNGSTKVIVDARPSAPARSGSGGHAGTDGDDPRLNDSVGQAVGRGKEIDFKTPYRRITMADAIKEHTGFDISNMGEENLRNVCKQLHIHVDKTMGKGKLIDEIFSEKCEKHFVQPTFIIDYPKEMSPLTKKHRSKEGLVERFELMVNGKEIANAYSELNDPIDQRDRFEEQTKLMERGDAEAMFIDHDFLRALEYGMPPTSGIGIGIDRLCMLLLNQPSIQDVLLFPMMRPEKRDEE